ncbi:MAG: hypothetical protein H0Z24_10385 [Thermosipho sp. (in: Bacteria)]|nr:hypothetical protein [Thermosipho sp. (in: thermotogales)]
MLEKEELKCRYCGRVFKRRNALVQHERACKEKQDAAIEEKTETALTPEETKRIEELIPDSGITSLYRQLQKRELEELLMEDLRLRVLQRKLQLEEKTQPREGDDGRMKELLDEIKALKREINALKYNHPKQEIKEEKGLLNDWKLFKEFLVDVSRFLGIEDLKRNVEKIDENYLKLREIQLQGELKKMEAENQKEIVERIAQGIERGLQTVAHSFGMGLASSEAGARNFIVVGNEIRGVCPQCGAEIRKPLSQFEEGGEVICPICSNVLLKKPSREDIREDMKEEKKLDSGKG